MIDQYNFTEAQRKAAVQALDEHYAALDAKREALRTRILTELLSRDEWVVPGGKGWGNLRQAWAILYDELKKGTVEYDRKTRAYRLI